MSSFSIFPYSVFRESLPLRRKQDSCIKFKPLSANGAKKRRMNVKDLSDSINHLTLVGRQQKE
jgi:hypothetical protein